MATIVVVEQDMAVRALLGEWLAAAGHAVEAFGRLEPARPALAAADLLIVAMPSPRLPRIDLLAAVRARHPRLPAIGLSASLGRSLPGDSAPARARGLASLLAKPFERGELLGAVAAALERPASA